MHQSGDRERYLNNLAKGGHQRKGDKFGLKVTKDCTEQATAILLRQQLMNKHQAGTGA